MSLRAYKQDPNAGAISFALGWGGAQRMNTQVNNTDGTNNNLSETVATPLRLPVSAEEAEAADADYARVNRA